MKITLRLLSAIMLLLPAALSAQTPEADVQRTLARARQADIPVELLESKIAEGLAKGVPMDRIAAALQNRLEILERVRQNIDPQRQFTSEELNVSADALAAGVEESALRTISGNAPRERRSAAIAALSQLVRLGHPSADALRRVTDALNRGPQALMNLSGQAASARRGPPPRPPGADAAGQGRRGPPGGVPGRGRPPSKPGNPGN